MLVELARACDVRKGELTDIELVDYAGMLTEALTPVRTCRRQDKDLAFRVVRAVAEAPSPASGAAHGFLALFYKRGLGVKADQGLSRFHARRAWLLGARLSTPFDSPAEAGAYRTDPESIAFLRDRVARSGPPKERVWLAEALLARRASGDVAEARTLLRTPEAVTEPAARLVLAELALEPGADPADVADAAIRLRPVAPFHLGGAKVRSLLLRLGRLQLASARTPEERWDAVQSLAAAAYAGEAEPRRAFREALFEANGGLEPASVAATVAGPRILAEDYPAWALREKVSGVVRLRALLDPRGRIVFTEPAEPGQPEVLVGIVRRIYGSRKVAPLAVADRPTPYVWVAIPPFEFRIAD